MAITIPIPIPPIPTWGYPPDLPGRDPPELAPCWSSDTRCDPPPWPGGRSGAPGLPPKTGGQRTQRSPHGEKWRIYVENMEKMWRNIRRDVENVDLLLFLATFSACGLGITTTSSRINRTCRLGSPLTHHYSSISLFFNSWHVIEHPRGKSQHRNVRWRGHNPENQDG